MRGTSRVVASPPWWRQPSTPVSRSHIFVVFRSFLRRHGIWLLLLAGAFLAASAAIDVWFEEDSRFLAEDGSKLFGIVTRTTFFVAATVGELRLSEPEGDPPSGRERSLPPIRAVVFDMDGVIIDSEHIWDEVREQLARDWDGTTGPRRSAR